MRTADLNPIVHGLYVRWFHGGGK